MEDFFTESQFIQEYFSTSRNNLDEDSKNRVVDIGGKDTNEYLRIFFTEKGFVYNCVDTCDDPLVDTIVSDRENLPFTSDSIDLVIISVPYNKISRCKWLITEDFNEMIRILKPDGFLFIKEPVNKNNRVAFFSDAVDSLIKTAEKHNPVRVIESFHYGKSTEEVYFLCFWEKVKGSYKTIERTLIKHSFKTSKRFVSKPNILLPMKVVSLSKTFDIEISGRKIQFFFSNSSIIEMMDTDVYLMNVRCINYVIENKTPPYHVNSNNLRHITINKTFLLDGDLNVLKDSIMQHDIDDQIEDIRLYTNNGEIYYSGSYHDKNNKHLVISHNKYVIKSNKLYLTPNVITVDFEKKYGDEKNWAYFDYIGALYDNKKCVIYQWYPLKICKIVDNSRLVEVETRKMPEAFKTFRGSSGGVVYEETIWFVIHERIHYNYQHYFVCFDKNMNLLKYSDPFFFESYNVEYCMSFLIKNDQIIIPYTVRDSFLKIGVYDRNYIMNELPYTRV